MNIVVLGDLNLDVLVDEREMLAPGMEVRDKVAVRPGGSAGTFARIAAGLGAHVTFIGAVGTDLAGDLLVASLRRSGVDPQVIRSDRPTGIIVAIHRADDRSMICSRGANDALRAEQVSPDAFRGAVHLHLSGYAFLSNAQRPAALASMARARTAGLTISVDPPPSNLIRDFGVRRFLDVVGSADMMFPNEGEGRLLTGYKTHQDVVRCLSELYPRGALTLGAAGAFAWDGRTVHRASPKARLPVDPTGAGDAFAAGFVVALLKDQTIQVALDHGIVAAEAYLAQRLGA